MTKTILTIEKLKLNLSEKEIKRLWNKWLSEPHMKGSRTKSWFKDCLADTHFMQKKYAEEKTIQNLGFDWKYIDNKRALTFNNKVVYIE